jgi:hypothetical protein
LIKEWKESFRNKYNIWKNFMRILFKLSFKRNVIPIPDSEYIEFKDILEGLVENNEEIKIKVH